MFAGIIDFIGKVASCDASAEGRRLAIRADRYWDDVATGGSVAIDGVCLTMTRSDGDVAWFDVVAESLRRTTLGDMRPGDRVNLQKSLRAGDRIDGHFVQGHVDAVATVAGVKRTENEAVWWFEPDRDAMRFIVPKGSIAIDGISLTVTDARDGRFGVALIPTTLSRTTLGQKREGARVNIETDVLARTVVQCLESTGYGHGPPDKETVRRTH